MAAKALPRQGQGRGDQEHLRAYLFSGVEILARAEPTSAPIEAPKGVTPSLSQWASACFFEKRSEIRKWAELRLGYLRRR